MKRGSRPAKPESFAQAYAYMPIIISGFDYAGYAAQSVTHEPTIFDLVSFTLHEIDMIEEEQDGHLGRRHLKTLRSYLAWIRGASR